MISSILTVLALTACGHGENAPKEASPDTRVEELRAEMDAAISQAKALRDPATGWLTPDDCDGALWTGLYCAASGVDGVVMAAAELPDEPGRFDRKPPVGSCTAGADSGWSSWSRDQGTGLLACAWRKRDRALLERHADYGRRHLWRMGEPFGDGRSTYTPAFVGRLMETIYALGGADDLNRLWPDVYPRGLVDYQAHLQVLNIWHRGEVEEALAAGGMGNSSDATKPVDDDAGVTTHSTLDARSAWIPPRRMALQGIKDDMVATLQEQATRDPRDPLFAAVLGTYTGDMAPAITLLLDPERPVGSYVRCNEPARCHLAAWIFAADIVLKRFPVQ